MIIFLYGQNTFRSRQKLNELKDKFIREVDPSGYSLVVLDGKTADIEQVNEKIMPGSLLTKKRMIIIEDIFLNKNIAIFNEINDLLSKTKQLDDNIVIFRDSIISTDKKGNVVMSDNLGRDKLLLSKPKKLFQFLSNQKYAQEFKPFSNIETANWVKKQVEARSGNISYQAIQTLISLIGNDLWFLNNEIDKLINYKTGVEPRLIPPARGGKSTEISIEDVRQSTRNIFDENIFALTDALSVKNKASALKLLEDKLDAGLADSYLINMTIRQFKILLSVRQSLDSGQSSRMMISVLKLHPFIVQKAINQVSRFSLQALKDILNELVNIDFKMKTGKGDARTMLNLFILKI